MPNEKWSHFINSDDVPVILLSPLAIAVQGMTFELVRVFCVLEWEHIPRNARFQLYLHTVSLGLLSEIWIVMDDFPQDDTDYA